MPAMILTRVDLPAPLSPTRATTSPGRTSRSTPSSAWTGPKLLLTPSRASTAPSEFMVEGSFPSVEAGGARRRQPRPIRYLMPACLHADAYLAVQTWDAFQKPSLMTVSLMLSLVTATGVRITDGTFFFPLSTCWLMRLLGGLSPLASGAASSAAFGASPFSVPIAL